MTDEPVVFEINDDSSLTVTFDNVSAAVEANYLIEDLTADVHYKVNAARNSDNNYRGFEASDSIKITYYAVDDSDTGRTCSITIPDYSVKVTGIKLDYNTYSIKKGRSFTLYATVTPTDADNKKVTWTSSNTSMATVDSNGKVSVKSNSDLGTVTITATTVDGNYSAQCVVTVTSRSYSILNESSINNSPATEENITDEVITEKIDNISEEPIQNETTVETKDVLDDVIPEITTEELVPEITTEEVQEKTTETEILEENVNKEEDLINNKETEINIETENISE